MSLVLKQKKFIHFLRCKPLLASTRESLTTAVEIFQSEVI